MKDYYRVLGLKNNCSSQDIRSKFLELTKEFHPDRNPDKPNNHEKILLINEAYSILSKPQLKQTYDISLRNQSFHNPQESRFESPYGYESTRPPPFYNKDQHGFEHYGHGQYYWDSHQKSQRQTPQQKWDAWNEEVRFYQNQNTNYQRRPPIYYAKSPFSNAHVVGGTIAIMLLSCFFHYMAVTRSGTFNLDSYADEPNARLKNDITRKKLDKENGIEEQLKNLETRYPPNK